MTARRMRVVFVAGSLGGGGTERRLVDILKHLDPERITARLYLAYRRGELLAEVPESIRIDAFWDGSSRRPLAQRLLAKLRWPSLARAWHLRDILHESQADIVFSWSLLPSYETALARRGISVPQMAAVGAQPAIEIEDAFGQAGFLSQRRAAWTYRQSQLLIANSLDLRAQFQTFYHLPPERVQTWLQTRDFERIQQLAAAETPTWPSSRRRIVAVGRLHPLKGMDVLLAAIAKVHEAAFPVQLTILGQGPAERELRQQAVDLGIAGQVRFLGFQPNPFPYVRTADVFVLPSRSEGNPNTLMEAMVCGIPVIAADCATGPREILDDGKLGTLVPPGDVGGFAAALRNVLENPPSEASLADVRQTVLHRYGLMNCTSQLEAFVRSVRA